MSTSLLAPDEEAQLLQTIEMFTVITASQPDDCESLEILKEAYSRLGRQQEAVQTSRRIAEAYVHLGQVSLAILEYESILQQFPYDEAVRVALAELQKKATQYAGAQEGPHSPAKKSPHPPRQNGKAAPAETDDGRQVMRQLFVQGKWVSEQVFNRYWPDGDSDQELRQVREPFVQVLADKNLLPLDQSLKLISERSRLSFVPLDRYDVDVELARGFPRELCLRWCVLPYDRMSKSVLVATANPFNRQAASDLEAFAKSRFLWYLAPPAELVKMLRKIFR